MNRKVLLSRGVPLILAMIAVAGCSSAVTEACPTNEPCQVISPLACPTQAAQLPVVNAYWYSAFGDTTAYTILFEPGDKCTITENFPFSLSQNMGYEIVVSDDVHQNYIVVNTMLEPDTTIDDVINWTQTNPNYSLQPPGVILTALDVVNPMSRTYHAVRLTESPFYFGCFVQGPGILKLLTFDGPYDIVP